MVSRSWLPLFQGGQDVIPHKVQFGLHVPEIGRDGDHGVPVGHNDYELAVRTVGTEGSVAATPHLIAIALGPIAFGIVAVGYLPRRSLGYPTFGQQLLAVPDTVLQRNSWPNLAISSVFMYSPQPPVLMPSGLSSQR